MTLSFAQVRLIAQMSLECQDKRSTDESCPMRLETKEVMRPFIFRSMIELRPLPGAICSLCEKSVVSWHFRDLQAQCSGGNG